MLKLERTQIDAIRFSDALSQSLSNCIDDPSLVTKPSRELSDTDYDILYDASIDALLNDSPIIKEFTAEQDHGHYSVIIQGVPGAYVVRAPEYDDEGAFSTLEEALAEAMGHYGEFLKHVEPELPVSAQITPSSASIPKRHSFARQKLAPPPSILSKPGKRTVLLIVTDWPDGTMAMKFGSVMKKALRISDDDLKLLQMEPERIFRAVTDVSETEFRSAISMGDISCPSRILFVDLCT